MGIEFREHNGELLWVRNPFTGAITYFTHVHKKRSGFQTPLAPPPAGDESALVRRRSEREDALRLCPFCPGNEAISPDEVLRIDQHQVYPERPRGRWLIRAVQNLIPRVPEGCTGGRNESYVVVEDPRHFAAPDGDSDTLLHSAQLEAPHFQALIAADVEVARRAYSNAAVASVLIRKNQGQESGASQPHVHNQVMGADTLFPAIAREAEVSATLPSVWRDIVSFARDHDLVIAERDGMISYFCPFGTFPRSYDVVCLDDRVRLVDLPGERRRVFAAMLFEILQLLGPMPLDYEVHEGGGVPLHAHVNARHYAYSNIGGTLNLPSNLLRRAGSPPR